MANLFWIMNDAGREYTVRVIFEGDEYGLNDCLVHDEEEPVVEFYDRSYFFDENGRGQFVSRYYMSTLLEDEEVTGLNLEDGVPDWYIDKATMEGVVEILKEMK